MSDNVSLSLQSINDQAVRDSLQKLQDFINGFGMSQKQFQACEIFVTGNTSKLKIGHNLGGIPLDAFVTRLIAPSAAKLTFRFADFTKTEIYVDVTGLNLGGTLSARILFGTFPDIVTVGTPSREGSQNQEVKGKFT